MGLFDKMKNFVGIEDQYDEDDYGDDYSYDDTAYSNYSYEEPAPSQTTKTPSYSSSVTSVIDMPTSTTSTSSKMRVSIQEPLSYDDGPKVIDGIAQARTVVLNLEMLEPENKRQIFDFVNGGVYALHGNIQKVTKDIYVIVPKGIDVDAAVRETSGESSLYQL